MPGRQSGPAAADAGVRHRFLLKRHATAGHAGFFLELQLAGEIAAPHRADVAAFFQILQCGGNGGTADLKGTGKLCLGRDTVGGVQVHQKAVLGIADPKL